MITSFVWQKKTLLQNVSRADLAKALWDKESLLWVDLENPTEFESEILIEVFGFHPLAIEDCLNDTSEPKIDEYEDHVFLVVHAADFDTQQVRSIELDMFVNKNYVVTFHKQPLVSINAVKELMARKASVLSDGTDMLMHAILDRLVDQYQPVLTGHQRRVDELEDRAFDEKEGDRFLQKILNVQKDVLYLKRIIGPQRDTVSHLSKNTYDFIKAKRAIYFRDIYDHLFRLYQMAEELDGILKGIMQVYFSHQSNQLNQAIKAMTILATIALPSIVIASIYGMNFHNIPELRWPFGYLFAIGLMIVSSALLLMWMKFKKWF